jgi:CBS domain-containing protein
LKQNPKAVRAWEVCTCTHKPVEVAADASIQEVGRLMIERGIHHVLVTRDGELLGIISSLDFVEAFLRLDTRSQ